MVDPTTIWRLPPVVVSADPPPDWNPLFNAPFLRGAVQPPARHRCSRVLRMVLSLLLNDKGTPLALMDDCPIALLRFLSM